MSCENFVKIVKAAGKTFQIALEGTIMCRVTDEKKYAKSIFMNGQELARESILMQYG